jgi:hypothetical protein
MSKFEAADALGMEASYLARCVQNSFMLCSPFLVVRERSGYA